VLGVFQTYRVCAILKLKSADRTAREKAQGKKMAWACYLLNEFLQDYIEAQNYGRDFHYS
jgi:hypothetical protein